MRVKKLIILLIFIHSSQYIISQTDRSTDCMVQHNWSGMGRDIELGVDQYLGNHVLHGGLSYFQNDALPGLENHRTYYRAQNGIEKIGINLGYKRSVKFRQSDIELLPKFEVQVFRIGSVYKIGENFIFSKKRFSYNSSVGLDGKVKLYREVFLVGGVEGGVIVQSFGDQVVPGFNDWNALDWQLNSNFSVGLLYRIGRYRA